MKPTVQAPDFYKIGNDYVQAPLSSFYDMTPLTLDEAIARGNSALAGEPAFYQDGIYTRINTEVLSGGFKDEAGFNKRRVYEDEKTVLLNVGETFGKDGENVKVTEGKEQPAYDSKQYGAADIVAEEQYVEGDEA